MKVVACLTLLLVRVCLSRSCDGEGQVLFCLNIPEAFTPGYSSLVMILRGVGKINSTVFHSEDLASVTRLRMENAGITGIAEGAFASFQNLTDLSLKQNLLTEINPNWFSRPKILSELNLTENNIEVLSELSLNGLISLTKLRLSNNRIKTIDPNSFSSQIVLAELDLSENMMTWVSPQVFRSLSSTRIRLDGNPWDCSCEAKDFVDFVKDLHNRSLLDLWVEVTCETPPSLRGQPVWNVSLCVTSPDNMTIVQPSVPPSTVPPSRLTPKTDLSVQPKPTDTPLITSPRAARPTSETKTSEQPKPTDILTVTSTTTLTTETSVTSTPSVTEISLLPKPSDLPITVSAPTCTEACVTSQPSLHTSIVCTLIVIVVLSLLLCLVCYLVVLYRRKRHNKTVTPGGPKENRNESKVEDGSRSGRAQSPGCSEKRESNQWDAEMGRSRSFTGVRAKSAGAILFTSPFCSSVKDQVSLQTETEAQIKESGNQDEGKQQLGSQTEVDQCFQTDNPETNVNKQAADGKNPHKDSHCAPGNNDTVPYLSIGTNQNKPDDLNQQDDPAQRCQMRKVLGRISTWPPTVTQWQAQCKMMDEEESGSGVVTAWTSKFPGEAQRVLNSMEHPFREQGLEKNQVDQTHQDPLKMKMDRKTGALAQFSKPKDETTKSSAAHTDMQREGQDPATVSPPLSENRNLSEEKLNHGLKPAERVANQSSVRAEPRRAVTSRQRAENRSTGSKAPSGGASPDDETLLSGNEYAFMDLLHEVVQNNGRWTRERWRQIHVNKQLR